MKRTIAVTISLIASFLLLCLLMYSTFPQIEAIVWALTSIVAVPICTAPVADKLGIQNNYPAVRDYILESLEPGMTPEEAKKTLGEFGSVEVLQTFTHGKKETSTEILVRLCDNSFGNVVLILYYSEDGYLIDAEDFYDD